MVSSTTEPYERVGVGAVTLNRRSVCMLKEAQRIGDFTLRLTQGSYNAGGVAASAGTHDGGGTLDASVRGLSATQITHRVRSLRKAGWAAWHRLLLPGTWPPHIHAVAIGDKELAPLARSQVGAYKDGRNGLASNGTDNGPRVDPAFFSDAFLARYVETAPAVFADASILHWVSVRFHRTGEQFTSTRSAKAHQARPDRSEGAGPVPVRGRLEVGPIHPYRFPRLAHPARRGQRDRHRHAGKPRRPGPAYGTLPHQVMRSLVS